MFDHITLKVRDFKKAAAFYKAALAPLGYVEQYLDETAKSVGYGPKGEVGLWLAVGSTQAGPVHMAFKSPSQAAVGAFYEAGAAAGGTDNGKPGLRPDYSKDYYAAFLLDPDGNNIEAVTFGK